MYVVLLKFADRERAGQHMDGHNAWLARGFADGVFLLAGGLQPQAGGAILAHNTARADLQRRVAEDPYVAEGVVAAEILEIAPARTDGRLDFLRA